MAQAATAPQEQDDIWRVPVHKVLDRLQERELAVTAIDCVCPRLPEFTIVFFPTHCCCQQSLVLLLMKGCFSVCLLLDLFGF